MATDFKGQVGWLIAVRAMVGTLLLGGATLAQITAPGSFAVHPFFWLIALTYGLTILWAWCLRFVERDASNSSGPAHAGPARGTGR